VLEATMSLRTLLLLKLVCCGGPLLILLVPSTVFVATATTLANWAWPVAAAGLTLGAVLWRVRRRAAYRVRSEAAPAVPPPASYAAQQESFATSRSKASAPSFSPSAIVK
jgi:hypothetical protein